MWECQCECGNKTIVVGSDLTTNHTNSCGCLKNSLGELKIKNILQKNNILFIEQKTFDTCKDKNKLKFDFFINNKYLIEYDGNIHYKITGSWNTSQNLQQTQKRDKIKNEWCKNNNIPLIRIPYYHYNELCLNDLLLETTKYRVV